MNSTEDVDTPEKRSIHIDVPPRLLIVPGTAFIVGSAIGIMRGGRAASLRFLAENVHRPPRTVQGWYFYKKTKNYRVMLGGLKGAGVEGGRLAVIGVGWVGIEEGMKRVGWGELSDVGAAVGTAGLFSAVYRLPMKLMQRTVGLGAVVGVVLSGMKAGRKHLEASVDEQRKRESKPL